MEIYLPEQDSFLLSDSIKNEISKLKSKNISFFEVGVGSGYQLETAQKLGIPKIKISGVDINNDAIYLCREKGFNVIKSNLFSKISPFQKFDFIIFNPPYLPSHKFDKLPDTSGGKNGDETILKFLTQVKSHISQKSIILLLTSSLTPMNNINKKFKDFNFEKINEKKLFQETLYIWKLKLKKS